MPTKHLRPTAARRDQTPPLRRLGVVALAATLVLLTACGEDGEVAGGPSTTAVAAAEAPDPGQGEPRKCEPVGVELEVQATETVAVSLDEYAFDPTPIEVQAGTVTFEADNVGEEEHELAFLPGGGDIPVTDEGTPDEDALEEAGAFELEAFGPGQTCNATYALDAGTYTLFCIVEASDGETHLSKGMRGQLVVQ
jgi:plastocyanin